jgi:hypothetical protein
MLGQGTGFFGFDCVVAEVYGSVGDSMGDGVISAWERREAEAQPRIRLFRTPVPSLAVMRITTLGRLRHETLHDMCTGIFRL